MLGRLAKLVSLTLRLSNYLIMSIQFVNVGFGSIVSTLRIVAIVSPDSAPIKRHINEAKERGQSIDGTYGRKTRAVLIMDSGHVVLSAIQPETIASRAQGN